MANENPSLQARLAQILGDLLQAAREGRAVNRMEVMARHPELAEHLRAFFAAQDQSAPWTKDAADNPAPAEGPAPDAVDQASLPSAAAPSGEPAAQAADAPPVEGP